MGDTTTLAVEVIGGVAGAARRSGLGGFQLAEGILGVRHYFLGSREYDPVDALHRRGCNYVRKGLLACCHGLLRCRISRGLSSLRSSGCPPLLLGRLMVG